MQRMSLARMTALAAMAAAVACSRKADTAAEPEQERPDAWTVQFMMEFNRQPDSVPSRWRPLIGEYGADTTKRWFVIERDGRLWVMDHFKNFAPLNERADKSDSLFDAPVMPVTVSGPVRFQFDSARRVTAINVGDITMPRRAVEPPPGTVQMRVTPVRPLDELRREALAATPPAETGRFEPTDLVEVTKLDSTIRLDVRYATENNFLGARMYDTARVFMQRAAAEALVRANKVITRMNGRLMIYDGYRPWYVTKVFWDATPEDKRWLVANPAQGSRHNRGIAVDISIYDLDENKPLDMPSGYDEATERAHSLYPGGTSQQRWNRALLRRILEHEGFAVNPTEWWHFDFMNRKRYAIGNIPFDKIPVPATPASEPKKP